MRHARRLRTHNARPYYKGRKVNVGGWGKPQPYGGASRMPRPTMDERMLTVARPYMDGGTQAARSKP
jgi:hypothetical protein